MQGFLFDGILYIQSVWPWNNYCNFHLKREVVELELYLISLILVVFVILVYEDYNIELKI